jgi:hypothetical protein
MEKLKVLFLSANPVSTTLLQLDEEAHAIDSTIRAAEYRDSLELITKLAVRPDDLLQYLLQYRPHIVHFSGHGSRAEQIILLDSDGHAKPVSKQAIESLFRVMKGKIRLVFLNACFSRPQAEAIVRDIDFAIGMNTAVGDRAAIVLAASFYRAIGFGYSVRNAFDQGKVALLLNDIPGDRTPELLVRVNINPDSMVFLPSPGSSPPAEELAPRGQPEGNPALQALQNLKTHTRALYPALDEAVKTGQKAAEAVIMNLTLRKVDRDLQTLAELKLLEYYYATRALSVETLNKVWMFNIDVGRIVALIAKLRETPYDDYPM